MCIIFLKALKDQQISSFERAHYKNWGWWRNPPMMYELLVRPFIFRVAADTFGIESESVIEWVNEQPKAQESEKWKTWGYEKRHTGKTTKCGGCFKIQVINCGHKFENLSSCMVFNGKKNSKRHS